MVNAFFVLFQGLFMLCISLLAIGMIRPVWVLWFLDRASRLVVLRLYGGMALVFFLLWKVLSFAI